MPEEVIARLKPLILKHYFDAVELRCSKSAAREIQGFCGVVDENMRSGLATALVINAIKNQG